MVGIFENIGDSFKFGFRECYGDGFKGFLRMLLLAVLFVISFALMQQTFILWSLLGLIILFPLLGICLKIFRGDKPDFTNIGQSLLRGLLSLIVVLIYMLIPIILAVIFGGIGLIPALIGGDVGAVFGGIIGSVGIVIALIAAVILFFVAIPAEINFARNGFAAAFKLSEVFGMISKAGFAKYVLSYIVYIIIDVILLALFVLLCGIPILGIILGLLVSVPITFFEYKFWANIFAA